MGDRVKTALGDGLVVDYRPTDNVYVVRLCANRRARLDRPWWGIMYLSAGSEYNTAAPKIVPEEDSGTDAWYSRLNTFYRRHWYHNCDDRRMMNAAFDLSPF